MEENEKPEKDAHITLPRASSSDLRGKQSVRATFKLSERAIDALSIVAIHLGIKQKSLFDHLIDDTRSLKVIARDARSFRDRMRQSAFKKRMFSAAEPWPVSKRHPSNLMLPGMCWWNIPSNDFYR